MKSPLARIVTLSTNGNEESTGENCHFNILIVNAITP